MDLLAALAVILANSSMSRIPPLTAVATTGTVPPLILAVCAPRCSSAGRAGSRREIGHAAGADGGDASRGSPSLSVNGPGTTTWALSSKVTRPKTSEGCNRATVSANARLAPSRRPAHRSAAIQDALEGRRGPVGPRCVGCLEFGGSSPRRRPRGRRW